MDSSSTRQRPRSGDIELCVRCGNCKANCPTHIEYSHEGMGPRGRIELLKRFDSGEIEPTSLLDDRLNSCLMCGNCEKVCPLGIKYSRAVYRAKEHLAERGKRHQLFRSGVRYAFRHPALAFSLLRMIENSGLFKSLQRLQPFKAIRECGLSLPERRLRRNMSVFKVPKPVGRVALFAGCTVDFLYPHLGEAFIRALNAMQYEVVMPKGEVCCGAPLLGMGLREDAVRMARRNIAAFKKLKADAVISLCPTCVHFLKDVYADLTGEAIDNATDISSFLCRSSNLPARHQAVEALGKVTFHDPCHALNYLGIAAEPRKVLSAMGIKVHEPAERGCCGLGGTVRLLHEDVSAAVGNNRAAALSGADTIVTSCPNCIIQLGSRVGHQKMKHIIELIADCSDSANTGTDNKK